MAEQQEISIGHLDSDDADRQEMQLGDEEPELETEPNSITGICFELLDRIFGFLDLKSLTNVAQTCKHLQNAAATIFEHRYGEVHVILKLGGSKHMHNDYNQVGIFFEIFDTKFCLSFLRCFGSKIFDLEVQGFSMSPRQTTTVDQYIQQYCANTLTEISYFVKHDFPNELFENSFRNVKKVSIRHINLGCNLPSFVNWFPDVRHLFLERFTINSEFASVSFPHLEQLYIHFGTGAENLIKANRQLQSISVWFNSYNNLALSTLLDHISEHKSISKLCVRIKGCFGGRAAFLKLLADSSELMRLASEHRAVVELNLNAYILTVDDVIALVDQLPSLESFEFRVNSRYDYDRLQYRLPSKWQHGFNRILSIISIRTTG